MRMSLGFRILRVLTLPFIAVYAVVGYPLAYIGHWRGVIRGEYGHKRATIRFPAEPR